MTVRELMTTVKARRAGSDYTDKMLMEDLNRFEAQVQAEIYDKYDGAPTVKRYTGDEVLRIEAPWDEMYIYLLMSKIDYANGEIDDYNNAMSRHYDILTDYKNHYARTHKANGHQINPFGKRRDTGCGLPL